MVGNACWELFCLEHGIQPDGTMKPNSYNNKDAFESFFNEYKDGSYVPRSLFIDLEPDSINKIRNGPYG